MAGDVDNTVTSQNDSIVEPIRKLLVDDYLNDLTAVLAHAQAYSGKIPDQINNEVRNFLTHVARAWVCFDKEKSHEAHEQLALAKGHLKRATRDCIKLSIFAMEDEVKIKLRAHWLYTQGIPPAELLEIRRQIEQQRLDLSMQEAKGESIEVGLMDLFGSLEDISERLDKHSPKLSAMASAGRRVKLWRLRSWAIIAGFWGS